MRLTEESRDTLLRRIVDARSVATQQVVTRGCQDIFFPLESDVFERTFRKSRYGYLRLPWIRIRMFPQVSG